MGRVIFIGAGPGAADLITVRGAQRLAQADVVLFDALADPDLRSYAPQAEWVDVGKRGFSGQPGCDSNGQARINALLVDYGRAVPTVVRLKGGDPSIFGRLDEELAAVRAAGLDCEVVPGVTAALAAAASSLKPLTRRGSGRSVSLATAMTRTGDMHATRTADTEIYYMAGRQLAGLAARLADAGWPADTPVAVVSRAGWPDQLHSEHTVATLGEASDRHAGRPTAVVVGVGATAVTPDAGAEEAAATAADEAAPTAAPAAKGPPPSA